MQIDTVRKISPQNDPKYPGHTFDFVAQRDDGPSLAIEVTNAWDETWLRAQGTMMKLADRLTPKLAAGRLRTR